MIDDIWDIFQQEGIQTAAANAEIARRDVRHTAARVHADVLRLDSKVDGLALICQALWEVVREKTDLREEDIERKIREIDLRDGRKDGRMMGRPIACPGCNRPTHTRQRVCMYCGSALRDGRLVEKP